jgi:hypothetical protein
MSLSDVSNILWRERQLLELLLFKLEEEQLVLLNGKNRWVAHATREVEMIIEQLKEVELQRAMSVQAAAKELGFTTTPSLRELAQAAPAPWNNLLDEHRRAFLKATQEVESMAQANREMLAQGHRAAKEALTWLGLEELETYGPDAKKQSSGGSGANAFLNKAV